jgi:hypothetical protein
VVGFTIGSRGKVPGKNSENIKRNNSNFNNSIPLLDSLPSARSL